MKYLLLALLVCSMTACLPMSESRANRALESQGFSDIQLQGMSVFGCSDDDTFRRSFTAKNANGKHVKGVVCGGIFKGATIRTD